MQYRTSGWLFVSLEGHIFQVCLAVVFTVIRDWKQLCEVLLIFSVISIWSHLFLGLAMKQTQDDQHTDTAGCTIAPARNRV